VVSTSEIDEKDVVVLGGSNFMDLVNSNKFSVGGELTSDSAQLHCFPDLS
jgi:hypothetical protein